MLQRSLWGLARRVNKIDAGRSPFAEVIPPFVEMSDIYILNTETQYRKFYDFFLDETGFTDAKTRRLKKANISQLRRFIMSRDDFNEWVWENRIKGAGEPYCFYIKLYSFVADEMRGEIKAVKVTNTGKYELLDRWDLYLLDNADNRDEVSEDNDIYFVRHEDLDNEIYLEETEAEEEALEEERRKEIELMEEVEADARRKDLKVCNNCGETIPKGKKHIPNPEVAKSSVSDGWAEVSREINGDIANGLLGEPTPELFIVKDKKIQMVEEPVAKNFDKWLLHQLS